MGRPVPPLGLFHTGWPSHCAAAGVASNTMTPSVNPARIDTPSGKVGGGWWRVVKDGGGCGGPPPPSSTDLHNLFLVHPHGGDRHAGERMVAEAARHARVEHAGQPEVRADAEAELQRRRRGCPSRSGTCPRTPCRPRREN